MAVAADSIPTSIHKGKFACMSRKRMAFRLTLANRSIGQYWGEPARELRSIQLTPYRTWRGERGEEWSSAQGLESILISIQSLMSSNPYENEPGYETARSAEDKKNIKNYVAKVVLKNACLQAKGAD